MESAFVFAAQEPTEYWIGTGAMRGITRRALTGAMPPAPEFVYTWAVQLEERSNLGKVRWTDIPTVNEWDLPE